jgi:hypothetical protein
MTEHETPQVIVEHGTMPVCDMFDKLRTHSANNGVTDNDKLLKGEPQCQGLAAGAFELHRIGDAVTSRNIHSAIYDALRLSMAL